ncbi:TPA: hypothetical protein PC790_003676 [Clostridioides difficile]|nr:hypothetical protein [Clostridioides difficile]
MECKYNFKITNASIYLSFRLTMWNVNLNLSYLRVPGYHRFRLTIWNVNGKMKEIGLNVIKVLD